ncbi:alpha-2-macroglobulin receptor-associated protein [Arctopsyche grandis]|uniref:alpha-2-macroglobulin receptor-associated protein n=1 Tax=Arctopsyche grandis TaxID=121162 RepID=UPI00406D660E
MILPLCLMMTMLLCSGSAGSGANKYSASANLPESAPSDFRLLNKPFRMAKLNLLWTKAQVRLTEPKLKSLYSDLKIHDKEELSYKRIKSEGLDKDGLKEAELRKKLLNVMSAYGLLEHFEDVQNKVKIQEHGAFNEASEEHINKSLFKDKKLNKLWAKAETSGFTSEELQALKEEFSHHQDKIEQYYSILSDVEQGRSDDIENAMDQEEMDVFNDINSGPGDNSINQDLKKKADLLRSKHLELRDNYDRLYRLSAKGPLSKDFVEPKVQQLWQTALKGDFKPNELESLRIELLHYESRLLKLRHLQAEHASNLDMMDAKGTVSKPYIEMTDTIKKQMRKVEKLHLDLENRILERHTEL